jgi:glycine/D-amino acid oxidase-like deaminating enzyme
VGYPCSSTAIVLGAGIQGICAALALQRAGWQVELIDRDPAPMLRTSLQGEGKVHLGYVYGNEPDRATAALMVEGALSFAELLDHWLPEPIDWALIRSQPYVYAILADSMVSVERLAEHYRWVDEAVTQRFKCGATYAGARTFTPSVPLLSHPRMGFAGDVVAAHLTSEIAVEPGRLRAALVAALQAVAVTWLPGCTVSDVERKPHGFTVTATSDAGTVIQRRADAVVNCLWDGRLAIDATMGIRAPRPYLYRLKHAVKATLQQQSAPCPTTTFALGPFGDVVWWSDGSVYLSWYPVCMTDVSTDLEPPRTWLPPATETPSARHRDLAAATVAALAQRIPALQGLRIDSVTAGVVVAWGDSDIDQPDSALHHRHAIGVHDHDGYLSVDTGKLTTAPLFAQHVVESLGTVQPS